MKCPRTVMNPLEAKWLGPSKLFVIKEQNCKENVQLLRIFSPRQKFVLNEQFNLEKEKKKENELQKKCSCQEFSARKCTASK